MEIRSPELILLSHNPSIRNRWPRYQFSPVSRLLIRFDFAGLCGAPSRVPTWYRLSGTFFDFSILHLSPSLPKHSTPTSFKHSRRTTMEHERPHLDRSKGDIEVGYINTAQEEHRHDKHAGPEPEVPGWILNWVRRFPSLPRRSCGLMPTYNVILMRQQEARKPIWFNELFAEFLGVLLYVIPGQSLSRNLNLFFPSCAVLDIMVA